MSHCLNPNCDRQNPSDAKLCQHCGSQLLLVDRYRAISLIGQGGFGRSLLSVDESETTNPRCVIKQFAPQGQGNIAKLIELFQHEAMQLDDRGKQNQ